jgi:hypothetical protein
MIMELDHSRQREGDDTVRCDESSTSFLARHRIVAMLRLNRRNNLENNGMKPVAAAIVQAGRIEQFQPESGYQS